MNKNYGAECGEELVLKSLTKKDFYNYWYYFLSLEDDIASTSKYVEPSGQENVFSIEYSKILVLTCIEVESVIKQLSFEINNKKPGGIKSCVKTVLKEWPELPTASVFIARANKIIKPFEGLTVNSDKLDWWDSYCSVKHSRGHAFEKANYSNAIKALSALYILIFYLAEKTSIVFNSTASHYITSNYTPKGFLCAAPEKLPSTTN